MTLSHGIEGSPLSVLDHEDRIIAEIDRLYDALESRALSPGVAAEVEALSDADQLGVVLRRIAIGRIAGAS
jgi:hypothetical protein